MINSVLLSRGVRKNSRSLTAERALRNKRTRDFCTTSACYRTRWITVSYCSPPLTPKSIVSPSTIFPSPQAAALSLSSMDASPLGTQLFDNNYAGIEPTCWRLLETQMVLCNWFHEHIPARDVRMNGSKSLICRYMLSSARRRTSTEPKHPPVAECAHPYVHNWWVPGIEW